MSEQTTPETETFPKSRKLEIKGKLRAMLEAEWKAHFEYVIEKLKEEGCSEDEIKEALDEVVKETTKERRYGKPLTEEERMERHLEKYGTPELPPRGTGLKKEVQTCPECNVPLYHVYANIYVCPKCGKMYTTKLEETVTKPKREAERVVRREELSTFTPAFLGAVRRAYRRKKTQTYWEWIIEPAPEGVYVYLRGVEKPYQFFPKEILS